MKLANQGHTIPAPLHDAADENGDPVHDMSNTPLEVRELTATNLTHIEQLGDEVSFYLELDGDNYHTAAPVGFAIGNNEHGYFVSRDIELLVQGTPLTSFARPSH